MEIYRRISTMDGRVLRETCGDKKECPQEHTGEPEKQLTTILVEAEAVVNSCPLVYVHR